MGFAVAISADTILVGAPRHHGDGQLEGAAYVFERDQGGPGEWGESAKLVPGEPSTSRYFGSSVAVDADTAVIGDRIADAAFVFQRRPADRVWVEVATMSALDVLAGPEFGIAVAVDGDTVAVADNTDGGYGAVFLFDRD